jgi:hypothetical protein
MTENCKLRKAILSAFYKILKRNFGLLLILWCSFKLWWNFCLDLLSSKFWLIGDWSINVIIIISIFILQLCMLLLLLLFSSLPIGSCQWPLHLIALIYIIYLALSILSLQQFDITFLTMFILTHPVNIPCGRKPERPEKTHDFRKSIFHARCEMRLLWWLRLRDCN